MRCAAVPGVVLCLLAIWPSAASATTRYATPAGSATDPVCAAATPCTLQRAVAVAQSGDDVQLAPGDYGLGADPFCAGALQISHLRVHGALGRPRPRLIGPPGACVAVSLGDVGAMFDVEVDGNGGGHALDVGAFAAAYRVVTGGSNGTVWVQRGGLLLNSVARAGNQTDAVATYNSVGSDNTAVVNVTAFGRVHVVADTGDQAWLDAYNTVATGGFRVDCDGSPSAQGHLLLDGFFGAVAPPGGGCASVDLQANPAGSGNPGLVPGDWHQLPGSALRDAGNDARLSLGNEAYGADIDGGPRRLDARVDIGADEFGSALPTVGDASASPVTQTTAVITAAISPNGVDTGAYAEFGPTVAYGIRTAAVPAGAGFGFAPVAIPLAGLQPNALYHFRVVTTGGPIAGDDGVFRTPAYPDGDGDGFASNVDCNDGNPAIHPGAREVRGNAVDENCDGIVAPFLRITATVSFRAITSRSRTRFAVLVVHGVPAGGTVELRCRGKRCPVKAKRGHVVKGSANLRPLLRHARLRAGSTLEIRVTAPESIGRVVRLQIGRSSIHRRTLCLAPGARTATKC